MLRGIFGDVHSAARLAVHLNGDGDGVGDEQRRIVGGPAAVEHRVCATEVRPAFLSDVRCERCEELYERQDFVAVHRPLAGAQDIHVLHHRRDGSVVRQCRNILADLPDRRVQFAQHVQIRRAGSDAFVHGTPDALEETAHAGDAAVAIVAALFIRAEEHQIGAETVSAPAFDELIGVHDIAPRLRHLGAFADDHPVCAEAREWLLEVEMSRVVQRHRDEARIEQVQHGVLVTADIGRDGQPALCQRAIECDIAAIGARVTQEIPCAVEEVVGDVRLATAHDAALRTWHAIPLVVSRER